eukprot:345116_1
MEQALNIHSIFQNYAQKYGNLNVETILQGTSVIILPAYISVIDEQLLFHRIHMVNDGFKKLQRINKWDKYLVTGYLKEQQHICFSNNESAYLKLNAIAFLVLVYATQGLIRLKIKSTENVFTDFHMYINHNLSIAELRNQINDKLVYSFLSKVLFLPGIILESGIILEDETESVQSYHIKNNETIMVADRINVPLSESEIRERQTWAPRQGIKRTNTILHGEFGTLNVNLHVTKPIQFLHGVLTNNLLFTGDTEFSAEMITRVIDSMSAVDFQKGNTFYEQNNTFYVIEYGQFEGYLKDNTFYENNTFDVIEYIQFEAHQKRKKPVFVKGHCFGEYALLYGEDIISLQALTNSRVWRITTKQFTIIKQKMNEWNGKRVEKRMKFISSIPSFQKLEKHQLLDLGHACDSILFKINDFIIKPKSDVIQNSNVYIIMTGTVYVILSPTDTTETTLSVGDYFGKNLFGNYKVTYARAATHCKILKIALDDFVLIMASETNLNDTMLPRKKHWKDKMNEVLLKDLEEIDLLGIGSFGKVSLVKHKTSQQTYALKKVSKHCIVKTGQETHIINEKRVLTMLESPFCIKLYATFTTERFIYFLTEPVLGGELFTLLNKKKQFQFDINWIRFFGGCVILALEHLHSMNIIYRDLKPQNLLLNSNGYLKLIDFGIAKKRNASCTLYCPANANYLAPEVIHNWIQSFPIDWWCLGVLLYEMAVGQLPFEDAENTKVYEKILTHDPTFPPYIDPKLRHLIELLLEKIPYQRLGAGTYGVTQIKQHAFFRKKLNFKYLNDQTIKPPYKPKIHNNKDTSNFNVFDHHEEFEEETDDIELNDSQFDWVQQF